MTDTSRIANSAKLYLGSSKNGTGNTSRIDIPAGQPLSKDHYGTINPANGNFSGDCAAFQKHTQWLSGYLIPYLNPLSIVNPINGDLSTEAQKWYEKVDRSNISAGDSVYFVSGGSGHVGVVTSYDPITKTGTIRSLTGSNNNGQVREQQFSPDPEIAARLDEDDPVNVWGTNSLRFISATRPRPETYVPDFDNSQLTEPPKSIPITHPGFAGGGDKKVTLGGVVTDENGVQKSVEVFGSGARLETNLSNGTREWVMPNGGKGHVRYLMTSDGDVEVKVFDASGQLRMHQQADRNGELIYHSVFDSQGFPTVSVDRRNEDIPTTSVSVQSPVENNPTAILAEAALQAGIDLAEFFEQAVISPDTTEPEDRSPAIAGQGDNSPSPYVDSTAPTSPAPLSTNLDAASPTDSTSSSEDVRSYMPAGGATLDTVVGRFMTSTTTEKPTPPVVSPEVTPSPRLDENGMPLPEVKEGAAYDPNTDPNYQTFVTAFRDAQAADHTLPADALQFADASDGTTGTDGVAGVVLTTTPEPNPTLEDANHAMAQGAQQTLTQAQNAAAWTTANAYAQGTQSALSFLQAIQQGNELSAAVAGVSMLNAFSKAAGHGQYFSPTTTAGLGAASAAMNLYDALKADDNLGALAAGTNLGSQVATLYAANASTQAAAQTAGSWAQGLGTAAGILGIANALKNGDETGAAISALIAFGGPAGALVGTVLAIGRALRGPKEPPEVHGEAEAVWTPDGNLDIRVSGDQNGGGERARSTLASLLAPIEEQLRNQTNAHGDPSAALIPRRLPSVTFHGQYESNLILRYLDDEGRPVERYYDGAGNRIGLDGSVESTFAEDFLDEVMGQNAIVPKWEADTIRPYPDPGIYQSRGHESSGSYTVWSAI